MPWCSRCKKHWQRKKIQMRQAASFCFCVYVPVHILRAGYTTAFEATHKIKKNKGNWQGSIFSNKCMKPADNECEESILNDCWHPLTQQIPSLLQMFPLSLPILVLPSGGTSSPTKQFSSTKFFVTFYYWNVKILIDVFCWHIASCCSLLGGRQFCCWMEIKKNDTDKSCGQIFSRK